MTAATAGPAAVSGRADAVRVSALRTLVAASGVALVVAAGSMRGALVEPGYPVLVPYSILIWVLYPTVAALIVVCVAALVREVGLPMWAAAAVVALTTAAWVSVGMGLPDGLPFGLLIAVGGAGAAAMLGSGRRTPARLVGAILIVIVAGTALFLMWG